MMNHSWKYNRHKWVRSETRTITLDSTYEGWDDFVEKSGIEASNETYHEVFDRLYDMYGDNYTKENSTDYLSVKLRYYIEIEVDKYNKLNEIWDNQIERLMGEYEEITQFRIGDLTSDPSNFDKYKSARQLKIKTDNILKEIKNLQELKTPIENLIDSIRKQLFIPVAIGDDYE